jgi:phosphate uptake regulator
MKTTVELSATDLLNIARLIHDKLHEKNKEYYVRYENGGIEVVISVVEDSLFGYCVERVGAHIVADSTIEIDLKQGTDKEIKNAL